MSIPHPKFDEQPEWTANFVSPVAPTPKPQRRRPRHAASDYDWWNSSYEERVAIQRAMQSDGGAI